MKCDAALIVGAGIGGLPASIALRGAGTVLQAGSTGMAGFVPIGQDLAYPASGHETARHGGVLWLRPPG